MRKVFIGVLAALMLVAFTACENNAATGMIYSLKATQNAVYVVGETPDAIGFTFTGYTSMGSSVSVDASDVALVKGDEANVYNFTYMGTPVYGSVEVEFEAVTGLTVDASEAVTEYYASVAGYNYETARAIDKAGLVVTAEYDGGEKVIDNKLVTATAEDLDDWTAVGAYDVTVSFQGKEDTYEIEIVPNLVESVAAKATSDNYTIYFTGDAPVKQAVPYEDTPAAADADGIYMEKTYQGGEVVVAASTSVKYQVPSTGAFEATFPTVLVPDTAGSATVTMQYTGTDGTTSLVGSARTSYVSINWVKKVATSVEMTASPATMTKSGNYANGAVSGFTFTVTSNDGSSAPATSVNWWNGEGTTPTGNYVVLSERTALADYTAGDRYVFHVTGSIDDLSVSGTFEATVQ